MTRYLFLDVDGVINAIHPPAHARVWSDSTTTNVTHFPVTYSPTLVEDIEMVGEMGVEIVWLTTWLDDTRELPVLGFGKYPYLGDGFHTEELPGEWWKWNALQAFVQDLPEGDHRFAWIDDDLDYSARCQPEIAAFLETAGVLGICPKTEVGITPTHLASVQAFFREDR